VLFILKALVVCLISLVVAASDCCETRADRGGWEVPSVEELVDCLENDHDPAVRQRAAWWLGEHEKKSAVPALVEALGDNSVGVRLVAAWALGEIKNRRTIDPLIRSLQKDRDPFVREMAALSLGEIESRKAVDALNEAADKDADLREPVRWALGEIEGWGDRSVWAGPMQSVVYEKGTRGRIHGVQVQGLEYSSDSHDPIEDLLKDLRDGDAEKRREVAFILGLIGVADGFESIREIEGVVDGLAGALRDPAPEVRARAIWSLDEINPSRSKYCGRR